MKIAPIIQQLAAELPNYTNKFSENIAIQSLVTSGTTATATTATPHGLSVGTNVVISGATDLVDITSLSRSNNIATANTATDHGLSMAMDMKTTERTPFVDVIDANESDFNGRFKLVTVPNRNYFQYENPGPDVTATGSPKALVYDSYRFFGGKAITGVTATTFTFDVDAGYDGQIAGNILAHYDFRISGAATLDRAEQSYTRFNTDQYWLFVIGGRFTSSKDRNLLNDATNAQSVTSEYRIRLIDDFVIVVFAPTQNELSGRFTFDELQDTLVHLNQSIAGLKAPQLFNSDEQFQLCFKDYQVVSYNTSYIVGAYTFETLQDITFYDTIARRGYYPARDINQTFDIIPLDGSNGDDIGYNLDLDDDPDFT